MTDIKTALLQLQAERFALGDAWEKAHELAQAHEGDARHDRLHAFLHRIEGDAANAAYWYRRCGEPVFNGDLLSECATLLGRES